MSWLDRSPQDLSAGGGALFTPCQAEALSHPSDVGGCKHTNKQPSATAHREAETTFEVEGGCPRAEKTLGANPGATCATAEIPARRWSRALTASSEVVLARCKLMQRQNPSPVVGKAPVQPTRPGEGGRLGKKAEDGCGGAAAAGERVSDAARRLPAGVRCQAPVSKTCSVDSRRLLPDCHPS